MEPLQRGMGSPRLGCNSGTMSESVYIAANGTFRLCKVDTPSMEICEVAFFSQLSLCANVMHPSTLIVETFADMLTLISTDLAQCVRSSPACIVMMYRYATQCLNSVLAGDQEQSCAAQVDDRSQMRALSFRACGSITDARLRLDDSLSSPDTDDTVVEGIIDQIFHGSMSSLAQRIELVRAQHE